MAAPFADIDIVRALPEEVAARLAEYADLRGLALIDALAECARVGLDRVNHGVARRPRCNPAWSESDAILQALEGRR